MRSAIRENLVKNAILLVVLIAAYPSVVDVLEQSGIASDKMLVGNLLVGVSILAVIACFGNFAFTYEKMGPSWKQRMLAHVTTGLLMLVIGLSLEMTLVLFEYLIGASALMTVMMLLLYVASVLYDFWDLLRFKV